ncbi:alkaline phosphatase [soil metagenome]
MYLSSRHRRRALVASAAVLALGSTAGLAGLATANLTSAPTAGLADHGGAARLSGDQSGAVKKAIDGSQGHNVILLIGDGMGDSEITVARNYAEGAAGRFKGIDALPLTGQYTTYSLDKTTKLPDYVPDSAATGSAWATGTKTYDGAISVDVDGNSEQNILELAKLNGLKTGDVSTAEIQDATPAVQISHISSRNCKGPVATTAQCSTEALENGGPGSISEQLLDTRPDVTLGGGAQYFDEVATAGAYAGQPLVDQAEDRGFTVVSDKAALDAVTTADQDAPLLGLFAAGNFPVRYVGPDATVGGSKLPAEACTPNPDLPATQPSLADMTDKAIELLDNPNGFFLQVEGASIDKQDHAANACGQIGETVDLDEAVQAAMAFAEKDGNTSVFVTADHAHSSQIIEVGSTSPGLSVTLTTADGAPMAVNYGTAPLGGSQQHTGSQLRVAGYGPQAANIVGLTDQTDLFFTMARAMGLVENPASASKNATVKVRPGKPKAGKKVTIAVAGYFGDRTATVAVKGGGKTVTKHLTITGGTAGFAMKVKKAGKYRVGALGDQSRHKAAKRFTVKK